MIEKYNFGLLSQNIVYFVAWQVYLIIYDEYCLFEVSICFGHSSFSTYTFNVAVGWAWQ